jgi:hypothetical protein
MHVSWGRFSGRCRRPKEVHHGYQPHPQEHTLLLVPIRTGSSPPFHFETTSKRRKGYPSATNVKKGVRVVRRDKELSEKLGRQDLCPCGSGRMFKSYCLRSGRFDGSIRNHYF